MTCHSLVEYIAGIWKFAVVYSKRNKIRWDVPENLGKRISLLKNPISENTSSNAVNKSHGLVFTQAEHDFPEGENTAVHFCLSDTEAVRQRHVEVSLYCFGMALPYREGNNCCWVFLRWSGIT